MTTIALTVNALFPLPWWTGLQLLSFFLSWLTMELAPQSLVVQAHQVQNRGGGRPAQDSIQKRFTFPARALLPGNPRGIDVAFAFLLLLQGALVNEPT